MYVRKGNICKRGHKVEGDNAYPRAGGNSQCKACLRITDSDYYQENREKINKQNIEWNAKNRRGARQ